MAKLSKARQRGVWPERGLVGYGARPRVDVTISMDREEYEWLAGFVHTTGHVWCVEDALNKAVSAVKGDEPMAHFAHGIAWQHGIGASDLLFRARDEDAANAAVDLLYMAALFLAEVSRLNLSRLVRDNDLPSPEVLALAQAAVGEDRDIQAEIEHARKEKDALDAQI
ncbi:MAG TPA: hypothetical protein VMN03_01035, partial [Burkholderiales bacterium]|nr:hypothetical protein [Burkholderiales bacterium]